MYAVIFEVKIKAKGKESTSPLLHNSNINSYKWMDLSLFAILL
jgi:hypothetical protein